MDVLQSLFDQVLFESKKKLISNLACVASTPDCKNGSAKVNPMEELGDK